MNCPCGSAIAAVLIAVAFAAVSYSPLAAQETLESGRLFGAVESGPYVISLYGLPEVPTVSKFGFTVTIESIARGELVDDADVEVIAYDSDGEGEWLSPALSFPPRPTSFVGNAPRPPTRAFSDAGEWVLEIRVDADEGPAAARVPITVKGVARRGTTGAAIAYAAAIGVIVVVVTVLVWRVRRSQRRSSLL